MTPDRAASIFRELLETPESELGHLPRRVGLQGHPTPPDLGQAQELLKALAVALDSGPGPNWDRVHTACGAMVAQHGRLAREATVGPPAWVRGPLPPKPTLGDPAPGSPDHATTEQQRERFVPQAPPAHGAGYGHAPPAAPGGYPPAPQAGYPQAPAPPPQASPPQAHQPPHQPQAHQPPHQPQAPAPRPAASAGPPPPPRRGPAPPPTPSQPNPDDTHISAGDIRNSVAKYAAFCAACAAQPERVFQTQVEYGVTSPEAREALDEDWQDRFDDDPELHTKWERLYRQFREQLQR